MKNNLLLIIALLILTSYNEKPLVRDFKPVCEDFPLKLELYTFKDIVFLDGLKMTSERGFNIEFCCECRYDIIGSFTAAASVVGWNKGDMYERQIQGDSIRFVFHYEPVESLDCIKENQTYYTPWYNIR